MDIVVIYNGLGNQMSQYAFYLAKKQYNKDCLLIFDHKGKNNHNGSELDKLFGIRMSTGFKAKMAYWLLCLKKVHVVSRMLTYIGVRVITDDTNYRYNESYVKGSRLGINFYVGGWPSEKHFKGIGDAVRRSFQFPSQTETNFVEWRDKIQNDPNSVSIHIRRGDYLTPTNTIYQFAGVASEEYFKRAMEEICKHLQNPAFYIFSDDIPWCREKFVGNQFHFVDCNTGKNSWRDMQLMSLCHHHINSNSTFSWWAAWLCPHKDSITLCPNEYIRNMETPDVYPDKWIKIDNK